MTGSVLPPFRHPRIIAGLLLVDDLSGWRYPWQSSRLQVKRVALRVGFLHNQCASRPNPNANRKPLPEGYTVTNDILIIKLSSLGDIFMALPHIDAILAHHPEDNVTLLTTPPFAPLFAYHPRLSVALLDRSSWIGPESTLGRMVWARKSKFKSVYDLQGNRVSRLVVRWSKADLRLGKEGGSVYNCYPPDDDERRHVFLRLSSFLKAAGMPDVPPRCTLYPSPEDVAEVKAWQAARGLPDSGYVLLHAGSSPEWPSKQWPEKKFATLGGLIEARGGKCVWIGGKEDAALNRRLAAGAGHDATGCFSIRQLYLLALDAVFGVTNDSGPMHVLAAAGIPVYSFFGPTSWARHHAFGQQDRVVYREVDCGPCYKKKCPPQYGHQCLEGLSAEDLFDRIRRDGLIG
jgi:ADP-heptose:LPS heptosyltransferase